MRNKVLLINGLNDGTTRPYESRYMERLESQKIDVVHTNLDWQNSENFVETLVSLSKQAKILARSAGLLSIVGVSAGGSMAVNLIAELNARNVIAVSIAGRLRRGQVLPFSWRTPERSAHLGTARASQVFYDSMSYCEDTAIPTLTDDQLKRITVIKPWLDEVVPLNTMEIEGANTIRIPAIEHEMACRFGLRLADGNFLNTLKAFAN